MAFLIIPFAMFLIVILFILLLVYLITRKVKQTAEMIFDSTLEEGLKQIEAEYTATPKSVSAVTSLYLPKIVRDFPEFNLEQMKTRAENVLVSYLHALEQNSAEMPEDCSPEFIKQISFQIQQNQNRQIDMQCREIKIHRTEISGYRKVPGRCIVTFQTALQFVDDTGMVQSKWNTEAIYVQDSEKTATNLDDGMGLNCPNCGAPITTLGKKVCEYCGTEVVELNIHVWVFNKVEQIK